MLPVYRIMSSSELFVEGIANEQGTFKSLIPGTQGPNEDQDLSSSEHAGPHRAPMQGPKGSPGGGGAGVYPKGNPFGLTLGTWPPIGPFVGPGG